MNPFYIFNFLIFILIPLKKINRLIEYVYYIKIFYYK